MLYVQRGFWRSKMIWDLNYVYSLLISVNCSSSAGFGETITPVHVLRDSMGRTVRSLQWRVRMTPALTEERVRKNSLVATSAAAPQPLPDPTVRRDLTAAATNLVLMVSVCAGHCINKMGFTLKLYITQRYKFCPLLTNLLTNVGFLSFCRTQTERF